MTLKNIITTLKLSLAHRTKELPRHIIAWTIFYVVDFCFVIGFSADVNIKFIIVYLSSVAFYISCFYTLVSIYNHNILRNRLKTWSLVLLTILCFSLVNSYWGINIIRYSRSIHSARATPLKLILFEVWRFSTSGMYAFAYWVYLQRIKEQELRIQTEQQLFRARIDFLKAQINPHFLFNTLNFVYGDISAKSKKAGEAILSLTHLLRYSVESTKSEKSNLKKEIDAIEDFISLQRVRFGKKLQVGFQKDVSHPFFTIPPLVLMSLVENAFKYGILEDPERPIDIRLIATQQNLNFKCKNAIRLDFVDRTTTSVGISNIRNRLDLVYGNDYKLNVRNSETSFEVELHVDWKN